MKKVTEEVTINMRHVAVITKWYYEAGDDSTWHISFLIGSKELSYTFASKSDRDKFEKESTRHELK